MTATTDRAVDLFVDAGMLAVEVDAFPEAVDALSDTLMCEGLLDMTGRCCECGRLVIKGAHPQRGCATAIPFVGLALWLWDTRYSIPYLGKALWLYNRRSAAHMVLASSEPPPDRGEDQ